MRQQVRLVVMLICVYVWAWSIPTYAQSKLDSLQQLEEVIVTARNYQKEVIPVQQLSGKELQRLNSHNIADALRYFSGIQIKDYGGVGGLKTVNIRSMGTNHVGVFYDGIELGNAQNGTVDLGRFSLDNMESVTLTMVRKVQFSNQPKISGRQDLSICNHVPLNLKGKSATM